MSSRAAEFASAILIGTTVGVFAGAYLITMPYAASDDCLTKPTGDTPQGQHWFYRIERGSKRHCWYLRDQAEKSSRVASSDKSSGAAARTQVGASQHPVAEAHAELRSRARIEDDTSAVVASPGVPSAVANAAAATVNTPVADDNGANVMSRWPEPVGASAAAPQPDTASPTVVADARTDPAATAADQTPVTADPAPPAAAPAAMTAAPEQDTAAPAAVNGPAKYSGSLQQLLMVAFAALALAGLTGSGVYRLAGAGRRKRYDASRRSTDWQRPKKKSRKARRAEPQPQQVAMDAESFAPKARYAPEPGHAPEPAYAAEPAYASEPEHDLESGYEAEPGYAPEPAYTPPNYAPRPQFAAPRPQFVPEPSYATQSDYNEYAPVSEYAPRPRARVQSRELDESYESIEQLLIRLAK